MWCLFCQKYIGFFNVQRYCEGCSRVRRIMLLHNEETFIEKIEELFLKERSNKSNKKDEKKDEKKEETKKDPYSDILKRSRTENDLKNMD